MVGQVVQELLDQGYAKAYAKGYAEGYAKGLAEGYADSLTWLLEHRFGQLPAAIRCRIVDAPQSELRIWFTVALDASSLETVFNGHDLD